MGDTGDRAVEMLVGEPDVKGKRLEVGRLETPAPVVDTGRPGPSRVEAPRLAPPGEFTPDSISLSARSTFGRLKLLLPNGPTMPADAPAKS